MKIICTKCGSTNIICEVWMNPNTGEIHHFSDESLEYEACWDCNEYCLLTDVEDTKETLQELYKSFKGSNKREPGYLHCDVMKKDGMKGVNVYIKIGKTGIADKTYGIDSIYTCKDLDELSSLCDFNKHGFSIVNCICFM